MSKEVLLKKIDQIQELLNELDELLRMNFEEFSKSFIYIRAAERNFQLVVDMASDINTQVLLMNGKRTPDSYKQSFSDLAKINLLYHELIKKLVMTAKLRNILVHEYDFEEDYQKFYSAAREALPAYREYIKHMYRYITQKMTPSS
jgi:uncharacterized protein YutE (UPF0331/DUF86 family)